MVVVVVGVAVVYNDVNIVWRWPPGKVNEMQSSSSRRSVECGGTVVDQPDFCSAVIQKPDKYELLIRLLWTGRQNSSTQAGKWVRSAFAWGHLYLGEAHVNA